MHASKPSYKDLQQRVQELEQELLARKQSEEALQQSLAGYQALLENAAEGIIMVETESKTIHYVNPALANMLGYTQVELQGRKVQDIHPSSALEDVLSEFEAQSRDWKDLACDVPCLRKDGQIIYADFNTGRVAIKGIAYNLGFVTDVTERRLAEQAREQQQLVEARLRQLAQALLTSMSIQEISGLVLGAGQEITSSQHGFVGTLDPQTGNFVAHTLTKSIWSKCQVSNQDIVFKHYSGLWGWVLENQAPLLSNSPSEDHRSSGLPEGHISLKNFLSIPVVLQDHTVGQIALANNDRGYAERDLEVLQQLGTLFALAIQRKKYEEELVSAKEQAEAASRIKSEFLANMSHELRTPLNGILGGMQFLQEINLNQEEQEILDICYQAARRLDNLLANILDRSRLETGLMEVIPQDFGLLDVLQSIQDMFAYEIRQKGLDYQWELDAGIPEVLFGDSIRLTQLLCNLVGNALKFTDQGSIHLEAKLKLRQGSRCRIQFTITDTGCGIPEALQEEIFSLFTQGEQGTSVYARKHGGVGLGLSLVKLIADLMQGHVFLESQEGQGTTVFVLLPFDIPQQAEDGSTSPGPEAQQGESGQQEREG
ncbi:MAG: ATP-binding protein [Thermodesulfobacteriota bacterium]